MKKHNEKEELKMEKESTAAEEFIDEQFLDVIRGDTHKILSGVYRTLKNLGCEDLPDVEEQFQIIESRVGNLIEHVITLQRNISEKPILL